MLTITLEEHFLTESFLHATKGTGRSVHSQAPELQKKLLDLGAGRLAAMDESGIDLQILSLVTMGFKGIAAADATSIAHDVNGELSSAVRNHPTRFAGFATLAPHNPASAAAELERCVTNLDFAGALIDGTCEGRFLDDPRFLPIFEAAAHLGVPIYLHPAPPPEPVQKAYFSGLPEEAGHLLSIAGWGWHAETGLHTLRLILSGLFDRLPKLQLIIGHMGEGIPYALARSSAVLSRTVRLRQTVADYFQTNIHITTSGYFTQPPLRCALEVAGIDRLMFSVDYPFSPNARGRTFLDTLPAVLTEEDLAKFSHGNAKKLMKLAIA